MVCGLVLVEAVLLVVGAGFLLAGAITTPNEAALPGTVFLIVVAVAVAAVLAFAAWGVLEGARWSRGPIFTWQLVQGGVSMPVIAGGSWYVGGPLLLIAICVGVLVAGRRVILRRPGD